MKRLVLFFLHFPVFLHGQWCIDFEDGSLLHWIQGRDSSWQVVSDGALSGHYSLRHVLDDSLANHDQIALPLDSLQLYARRTSWKFRIRHEYLPSSANHWAVYLAADENAPEMSPAGNTSAFILGVNLSGSDDTLKLWRQEPGHLVLLATTSLDWQEGIGTGQAYLEVVRHVNGEWEVLLEMEGRWERIGSALDTTLIRPDYFGIFYRYSSKQDRKFCFDDLCISGQFMPDTIPPSILSLVILDQNSLRLTFSEPVLESGCMVPGNFLLHPVGEVPDSLIMVSGSTCVLVFPEPFPNDTPLSLIIFDPEDRKGNSTDSLKVDFLYHIHQPNDIVFNEIMSDPSPAVELPEFEYIELYNRSLYDVNIGGWILGTGKNVFPIPHFELPAGGYLVLGSDDATGLFGPAVAFMGLLTSRTSLPNEGDVLSLMDGDSLLIDLVEYDPGMHDNEYFAGGGWSLERLDPDRLCMSRDNWATSNSKRGGTPGQVNSVRQDNPDREPPSIANLQMADSCTLIIEFSEAMEKSALLEPLNYLINPGRRYPVSVGCTDLWPRTAVLHFINGFDPGREQRLEISVNLTDCAGHPLSAGRLQRFAWPLPPAVNQLFISEILFDPKPYCPRFLEIYNRGPGIFDLADLRIGMRNSRDGHIEKVSPVSSGPRLFFPGEYLALTDHPEELMGCCYVHDPGTLILCKGLPVMDEEEGAVMITDQYLLILDEVSYDRKMQSPLLSSTEGVSLERISFEIPSDQTSNWHSAAATEGFATPGRLNSQHPYVRGNEGIEIEPEIFTPDQDGNHDLVQIRYSFPDPGTMATVMVLDPHGRIIKRIVEGQLLGTEGFFTWDGSDDHGRRARAGIYLVYARVFRAKGKVSHYRRTCVLSPGTRD
jgi:hypothetical protein